VGLAGSAWTSGCLCWALLDVASRYGTLPWSQHHIDFEYRRSRPSAFEDKQSLRIIRPNLGTIPPSFGRLRRNVTSPQLFYALGESPPTRLVDSSRPWTTGGDDAVWLPPGPLRSRLTLYSANSISKLDRSVSAMFQELRARHPRLPVLDRIRRRVRDRCA
jgi:hypothetical protein